jgi:hypothetical protein
MYAPVYEPQSRLCKPHLTSFNLRYLNHLNLIPGYVSPNL